MDRHIDMDLAYGDFHAASLALDPRAGENMKKQELSSLVAKCKMLLDEANCAQHSVKATIAHLQKNPEAMAAVALTLAEISNVASRMAPGALAMIKGSAPSVFAMLAAPEFLIAVGVGVGLTVVMFGGYKIIKKIQAKAQEGSMDEAIEIGQLDRIERWRHHTLGLTTIGLTTIGLTPSAMTRCGLRPLLPTDSTAYTPPESTRQRDLVIRASTTAIEATITPLIGALTKPLIRPLIATPLIGALTTPLIRPLQPRPTLLPELDSLALAALDL
ncbi:hypothetical protein DV737_g5429, partial [Chaetothyriales sp. CBS 132003]